MSTCVNFLMPKKDVNFSPMEFSKLFPDQRIRHPTHEISNSDDMCNFQVYHIITIQNSNNSVQRELLLLATLKHPLILFCTSHHVTYRWISYQRNITWVILTAANVELSSCSFILIYRIINVVQLYWSRSFIL